MAVALKNKKTINPFIVFQYILEILDNVSIKSIIIWNMIDKRCVHINIKAKCIQLYWYETRLCVKDVSPLIYKDKCPINSMTWNKLHGLNVDVFLLRLSNGGTMQPTNSHQTAQAASIIVRLIIFIQINLGGGQTF